MSKITNDGLTRSGTGCFIAVPIIMATVGVKGLTDYVTVPTVACVTNMSMDCSSSVYRRDFVALLPNTGWLWCMQTVGGIHSYSTCTPLFSREWYAPISMLSLIA